MSTLYLCRGLPGSGKTTYARQAVAAAKPGRLVRVNRDDLRRMLFGPNYTTPQQDFEVEVTCAEHAIILNFLVSGTDVICDDTNLYDQHLIELEDLAEELSDHVVILDQFLRVPLDVCIQRDAQRYPPDHVGATAIRNMWEHYTEQNERK